MLGCKAIAFIRADLTSDPGQRFPPVLKSRCAGFRLLGLDSVSQYLRELGSAPSLCLSCLICTRVMLLPPSQGSSEDSAR